MREIIRKIDIRTAAVTGLCFLLTSTGYLAWVYKIVNDVSPQAADAVSLVAGYLCQAAGIFLCAICLRRKEGEARPVLYGMLILHMLFLVPAVLGKSVMTVLVFGLLLNLVCGWIAGFYLHMLARAVSTGGRAITLGVGYGCSVIASWVLSAIGKGSVYYSDGVLIICLILTVIIVLFLQKKQAVENDIPPVSRSSFVGLPVNFPLRSFVLTAGSLILIFGVVSCCGFGFPSADLQSGINLEFSRLFYAAGLIIAGLINERSRRSGAICAFASLVIPFITMALKGEPVSLMIFWALSYFTFGFYSVYRILLFSDISSAADVLWLSGFGLFAGRIGDACGEVINLILSGRAAVLIAVTAVLFVGAVFLFFRVYHLLYQPDTAPIRTEQEIFNRFSARHDLSARERDVLRLLLKEMNNTEIADELSVSESTAKFHVHNILQKTGCKNRVSLITAYSESRRH